MKVFAALVAAVFVSLGGANGQQTQTSRPPIGVPADATFFSGKWYRVYLEKLRWTNAKDRCARAGGRLAVVPDEATHTFLRQLANDRSLWLGATDEKVESDWIWSDGTVMKFKAWDSGQPDNYKQKSYLYLRSNGKWHDTIDGDTGVVGYICEWNAK